MATFNGGPGNDSLGAPALDTSGNDMMGGGGGNDTLDAGAGTDTLNGGPGNDLLIGGEGGDLLIMAGGAPGTQFNQPPGTDTLLGGAGDDTLQVSNIVIETLVNGVPTFFPAASQTMNLSGSVFDGGADTDYLRVTGQLNLSGATLAGIEGLTFVAAGSVPTAQPNVVAHWGPAVLNIGDNYAALPSALHLGGVGQLVVEMSAPSTFDGSQYVFDAGAAVDVVVIGTDSNEAIIGTSRGDDLSGEDGDDTLTGGGGADAFELSLGQDVITDFTHLTDKFDLSDYGFDVFASLQPYLFASGGDTVLRFTYDGVLQTTTFKGVAFGTLTAEDFVLVGNTPVDGTGEDDSTPNADLLPGGGGNDSLLGAGGADTLVGFGGNDSLGGGAGTDNLNGGGGNDTLDGGSEADTLVAGGGADLLHGGDGGDVLIEVSGGNAGTVMYGDAGDDVLLALNLTTLPEGDFAGVTFDGGAGHDTLAIGGHVAFHGTLNSIEGLNLLAADPAANRAAAVLEIGSAVDLNSDFEGGPATVTIGGTGLIRYTVAAGDDEFDASGVTFLAGSSVTFEVHGSSGGDTLVGSSNGDTLNGEGGNDTISGGGGNDTLAGAFGNDSLSGGDNDDNLNGGAGADTLAGDAGNDTLFGGAGPDLVQGGAGADVLVLAGDGSSGATLDGGVDNDILAAINPLSGVPAGTFAGVTFNGGDGADTLTIGGTVDFHGNLLSIENLNLLSADAGLNRGAAVLITGSGLLGLGSNPNISGEGLIRYTIAAGDGDFDASGVTFTNGANVQFEVHGSTGADTIVGSSHGDDIRGGLGNDQVSAGAGADTVSAAAGAGQTQTVALGAGADVLALDAAMAVGGAVTVTDFATGAGGDALSITAFLAARTSWTAGDPFASGHLRLVQNGADARLDVDADGAGAGGFTPLVTFQNTSVLALTAANLGGWAPAAVSGGAGGDTMDYTPPAPAPAGAPPPSLDGGAGVDTLTISTASLPAGQIVGPSTITPSADGTALLMDFNGDGVTDLVVTNVEDIFFNGQQVVISGNLAGTGLAPNTIHYTGTDGNDVLDAGGLISLESIRAVGGLGNDKLIGANDDDTLEGGEGADTLSGRGGPDSLNGGSGADELRGGDDDDRLDGDTGADKLFGDNGQDTLQGGGDNDQLDGGNGKDSLAGGEGADVLLGGTGADVLAGGAGADTLTGGAGGDLFRIEVGGTDRILDFEQSDQVVFVGSSGTVVWTKVDADGDGKLDDLHGQVGGLGVDLIDVSAVKASDWIFS